MNPVETYLRDMRERRSTGDAVEETSYYPYLSNLLDELGKALKPKVRCFLTLKNRGAGLPDGGLFTRGQFDRAADREPKAGQVPERGAIEVKGPGADVRKIAHGKQVSDYLCEYRLVLVTNYRDFLLMGMDEQNKPVELERFTLAKCESEFWKLTAHPRKAAKQSGDQLCEYLKRVMLAKAPLAAPQDVAWFLGSYARDAKARVENHKDLSALAAVREALEQALGMKFTGRRGEHFFRSSLVQTIFYGIFSAWVLWHRENPARTDKFDWRISAWSLRVPFIRVLYDEVATPSKLGPLGLVEVLDWTAAVLNRVWRGEFFKKFRDEHAVQYFYEPFMEAYDPDLRKELGVWYTPTEIVQYQVARVDAALREELNLPDGLADPNVVVLDPCCGTGAYLVEVLRRIAANLKDKGEADALLAADLKAAAMNRVFGFEIMPAPFVVSHLQLGLMLHELGAPLRADRDERVGVYLTNALTGWQPPEGPKQHILPMPELEQERDQADAVKRDPRILVVLGNPPYNAFAGVSPEEEKGLVEPYKKDLNTPVKAGGWGIKKFNLDDLYVRFFRLAERRIAEMTGRGVVSFISNFSYLSDPSFVVMRQRFLSEFDRLWFDCMNGDSRETGKLTPEGKPDPSVFSTEYNREGIRVGTAICVMVRKPKRQAGPTVLFRHFWGANKRQDLLDALSKKGKDPPKARPTRENRFSFRPENVSEEYSAWPKLTELCDVVPSNGLMEKRGGALIDIDRDALGGRMRDYFSKELSWEQYRERHTALTSDQARFDPSAARKKAMAAEEYDPQRLVRYTIRPFETRWCYYTGIRPVWNEPRPALWEQCFNGNGFILCRPSGVANPEGIPFFYTRLVGDNDFQKGHAYYFPLRLTPTTKGKARQANGQQAMFSAEPKANLSKVARKYLCGLGICDPDADAETAGLIWMHALAVGYSPAYLMENADGIRRDWPRIPLPASREALEASAELGRRLAALLDTERPVPGVTAGKLTPALRSLGTLSAVRPTAVPAMDETDHGQDARATHGRDAHATARPDAHAAAQLNPDSDDLAVTAGWGHPGKAGVTMPGKGKLAKRPYEPAELEAIAAEADRRGVPAERAAELLGADTRDVYLNDNAYWRNVPAGVWDYHIGGYQVIKKWLSYRERKMLGRALRADEARYVTEMVRRIAAILLMQDELDANYRKAKGS